MLVQELSPALFLAAAMCGGGGRGSSSAPASTVEAVSPEGWTCEEIQLMTEAELRTLQHCTRDEQCDTVLADTGECPTDDLVVRSRYEDGFIYHMLDEADAIDCDMSFITPGDCPEFALTACIEGTCGWL